MLVWDVPVCETEAQWVPEAHHGSDPECGVRNPPWTLSDRSQKHKLVVFVGFFDPCWGSVINKLGFSGIKGCRPLI